MADFHLFLCSAVALPVCEPETSRIVVWGKKFILLFLESFCFTLHLLIAGWFVHVGVWRVSWVENCCHPGKDQTLHSITPRR